MAAFRIIYFFVLSQSVPNNHPQNIYISFNLFLTYHIFYDIIQSQVKEQTENRNKPDKTTTFRALKKDG